MCLIVLFSRQFETCPVILGANREERYGRPSTAPGWLGGEPGVFAGQDQVAGGTWLGANTAGVVVAITNRRARRDTPGADIDPDRRSRGLLCLDALGHATAADALVWARRHLEHETYNPYNLLLTDGDGAWVIHGHRTPEVVELAPGVHFLGEADVDNPLSGRVARARTLTAPLATATPEEALSGLQQALADTDPLVPAADRLCHRFEQGGTVSAAVLAVRGPDLHDASFFFAPGPPDHCRFGDLSPVLRSAP